PTSPTLYLFPYTTLFRSDPDREPASLRGLGLHADRRDLVVPALEVDLRVAPARAQEPDRLVHPRPTGVEILAERLVFGLLPADADTQPHATARERVERAHL